jgi:ATP-dependent Clp protease ATP-binding subunit ClpA
MDVAWETCKSLKFPFLTKEVFFQIVFGTPDTPFYNYLVKKGLTDEQIGERRRKVYEMLCKNATRKYIVVQYIFDDEDGNESSVMKLDIDIIKLFMVANKNAKECYAKESIGIENLMYAIAEKYSSIYEQMVDIYLPGFIESQHSQINGGRKMNALVIPNELASFLTVLNGKYGDEKTECHICGRDEEMKDVTRILMKHNKPNVVMVGEPGVGKTAIVEKFVWMIDSGNCPEKLKNSIVVSLDVNSIVSGTIYRGSAEQRFKGLIDFLETNKNCILFVDEIHLLLGAGACRDGDLDLANALKPLLARGETKVIGATTPLEYEKYFSRDSSLKRRFEKVIVNEPHYDEVYDMIKNQIKILEKAHNTHISKELVDMVIFKASCFNFTTKNPDRTLDLLDKTMVCAEENGRSYVTAKDVLENFNINEKKFSKMSLEIKKATAYHEAGHCIVQWFSDELIDYALLAVSIMPAEKYLGINVFEIDQYATPTYSKRYFIQKIAVKVAGRIAEEEYTNFSTAGASADLEEATSIAQDVVTKYALSTDRCYRTYSIENSTDRRIEDINSRINGVIEEARKEAENILSTKHKYLVALADELVERGMLSKDEIKEIFDKVDKESCKKIRINS